MGTGVVLGLGLGRGVGAELKLKNCGLVQAGELPATTSTDKIYKQTRRLVIIYLQYIDRCSIIGID